MYLSTEDVPRLASFLGMSAARFRRAYLYVTKYHFRLRRHQGKCPFLKADGCSVHPAKPTQVLHAASSMGATNKVIIVVDEDIDPKDPEMVTWAMSFAMQPHRDVEIIRGKVPRLDPSVTPSDDPHQFAYPDGQGASAILINACREHPYLPVSLPRRDFMEKALAHSGPALVDVVTDKNVLAMPPKATVQQAKGSCPGNGRNPPPHCLPAGPGETAPASRSPRPCAGQ